MLVLGSVLAYGIALAWLPWLFEPGPARVLGLSVSGPLRTHYVYADKQLWRHAWPHALPLLLAAVALFALLRRGTAGRTRGLGVLCVLVALALQLSLSLLEGRGMGRLSATLLDPHYGHSEFVVLGAEPIPLLALARDYERISTSVPRYVYARSKPPGQLLFYAACDRVMRGLGLERPLEAVARRAHFHERGRLTAIGVFDTLLFLLVSALPFGLLPAVARDLARWASPEAARVPDLETALVAMLMPCLLLVTMHLDQVLYPLLVVLAIAGVARALPDRPRWAAASGVACALGAYVSFSLLATLGVLGLLLLTHMAWGAGGRPRLAARGKEVLRVARWGLLGAAATLLLLGAGLGFDPFPAFARAVAHNAAWQGSPGLVGPVRTAHNLVELAIWIGWPAAFLLGWQWLRAARRWRRLTPLEGFTLLYPVFLVLVSTFGHTRSEIARLWIPLAVPLAFPLGAEVARWFPRRLGWYAAAALTLVVLVKNHHDFQ